jgi:CBS domain-containing protein
MTITINDLMRKKLITVEESTSVQEAAKKMKEKSVSSLVVVDADGKPQGLITEQDLVRKVCANAIPTSAVTNKEIMSSSPLITIKASSSVSEAADMMLQYNVRHLLIIDDKDNANKPLGIITPLDFTKYQKHVADEDKEAIQKVLQKDMASEVGISSSSSVHFEDGLESS